MKHLRKRHGIKNTDINVKDYFQRLDPRECELPLDEEAMTKIFGPPQKTNNDVLIGDFVTFTKQLKFAANLDHVKDGAGEGDDTEDEHDRESGEESGRDTEDSKDKVEDQHDEAELEPTDFVSVKIEHVEDEDEVY